MACRDRADEFDEDAFRTVPMRQRDRLTRRLAPYAIDDTLPANVRAFADRIEEQCQRPVRAYKTSFGPVRQESRTGSAPIGQWLPARKAGSAQACGVTRRLTRTLLHHRFWSHKAQHPPR
jgi:hypothetical protein